MFLNSWFFSSGYQFSSIFSKKFSNFVFNNSGQLHTVATNAGDLDYEFDGYLAEVHFIDGTALTPSSFGETGDYGEWKPIEVSGFRATNLSLRWLIQYSHQRAGRSMSIKLANEIIDTANEIGNTIKKKEETHKMAEANKAFAHFRY